ncbi:MAG: hypothetical protein LPK58_06855 [Gammaproteobacteria bacterium]|nr:hypothetical protein [Gammaproteobacteria bacterium]MDX5375294.1 hypothetical protein [Gammaproteobacteria bacterium]
MKPYTPVPAHVEERLEIAILCGEKLKLQWAEEEGNQAFLGTLWPQEIIERDQRRYLRARDEKDIDHLIRLDLIRNLPTPVK